MATSNMIHNNIIFDIETEYECCPDIKSKGFTKLMMLVMKTIEHPETNRDIDDYLMGYPNEINKKNKKGWTALMLVSANEQLSNKTMFDKQYSYFGSSIIELLLIHGADINLQNNDGSTALMLANSNSMVGLLLRHGADINLQNINGKTALDIEFGKKINAHGIERINTLLNHDLIIEKEKLEEELDATNKQIEYIECSLEMHPDSEYVVQLKDQ